MEMYVAINFIIIVFCFKLQRSKPSGTSFFIAYLMMYKKKQKPSMVANTFNPDTREGEAGRVLHHVYLVYIESSRPVLGHLVRPCQK